MIGGEICDIQRVLSSSVKLVCKIATEGCGEKVYAMGFFVVIVEDVDRFLKRPNSSQPAELGTPPDYNKHGGANKLNVLDLSGAGMRFLQPDFVCSGGIIVVNGGGDHDTHNWRGDVNGFAKTGDIVASRVAARKDMRAAAGESRMRSSSSSGSRREKMKCTAPRKAAADGEPSSW